MTTQVQVRGAATATQAARTLAAREIDIDTTLKRLNIHDGSTAGGVPHANYKDFQNQEWIYAAASGTDSIAITLTKAPAAYAAGQRFVFKAANTNTASATLNVNALGAKTIKKVSNGALTTLVAADIVQNAIYVVVYDGTDLLLVGGAGGATTQEQGVIIKDGAFTGGATFEDFTWSNGLYRRVTIDLTDFCHSGSSSVNATGLLRLFNNGTIAAGSNNYHQVMQAFASGAGPPSYEYDLINDMGTPSQACRITMDRSLDSSNTAGYSGRFEIANCLRTPMIDGIFNDGSSNSQSNRLTAICRATMTQMSGVRFLTVTSSSSRSISSTSKVRIVGYT